jgi:hypothetical protein
MISMVSLRLGCLAILVALGCGGPTASEANEPQTAKAKQLQEAKASGELDDKSNGKWGGWRYQGERKDCRYVFGRKCFKAKKAACAAGGCGVDACEILGAGPATVSCKKKK